MRIMRRTAHGKGNTLFLALTVGFTTLLVTSGISLAVPKQGATCSATGREKGLNACADSPGHTIRCLPSGDYMCCVQTQTGTECEEIEKDDAKSAIGKAGQTQRGQLQVAPTNPPPKTSPFQKGGTNAPIMRRGVEGEQAAEPAVPTEKGK